MKAELRKWKRRVKRKLHLPRRKIHFGDLARMTPFCRSYGYSRGNPVDRFYIEAFLGDYRHHIKGRVLELLNNNYTRLFGAENVSRSDVLDINRANPKATIFDDIRTLSSIADGSYDCVILTQTLHLIDDDSAALRQVYRILAPGGCLLLTVPCISRVPKTPDDGIWSRFYTDVGIAFLLNRDFQPAEFSVASYGNLPLATAFLYGLALEDMDRSLFEWHDPEFPLIVATCAKKPLHTDGSAQETLSPDPT